VAGNPGRHNIRRPKAIALFQDSSHVLQGPPGVQVSDLLLVVVPLCCSWAFCASRQFALDRRGSRIAMIGTRGHHKRNPEKWWVLGEKLKDKFSAVTEDHKGAWRRG
jgi:hypothetical protein